MGESKHCNAVAGYCKLICWLADLHILGPQLQIKGRHWNPETSISNMRCHVHEKEFMSTHCVNQVRMTQAKRLTGDSASLTETALAKEENRYAT